MCIGLRGHMRIKNAMCEEFEKEHTRACDEVNELTALFKEACWYNFETSCSHWEQPWHKSWGGSYVQMIGRRPMRRGQRPLVWYSGPVSDAPPLPPIIIYRELQQAREYRNFMREQMVAPHTFAPGGREYEKLLRESDGVKEYDRLYMQRRTESSKMKLRPRK